MKPEHPVHTLNIGMDKLEQIIRITTKYGIHTEVHSITGYIEYTIWIFVANISVADGIWILYQVQQSQLGYTKVCLYIPMDYYMKLIQNRETIVCWNWICCRNYVRT